MPLDYLGALRVGYSMPTFTPDTYFARAAPETQGHSEKYSLWRWYDGVPTGYVVLIREGNVVTPSPGTVSPPSNYITGTQESGSTAITAGAIAGSGEGGLAYFRGGITYTITSAEDTLLTAAGYTTVP